MARRPCSRDGPGDGGARGAIPPTRPRAERLGNPISGRSPSARRAVAPQAAEERPEVVATVAWAASNGDRSENGDYIYGKKRLREIDRRIRFLIRRLDRAEVVDPLARRDEENADQIFFGATVTVANARGEERTVSIVGVDEIDTSRGYISWVSPMARALIKAREGDTVTLATPGGIEQLDIVEVRYEPLAT